jgi:hypothetical protein
LNKQKESRFLIYLFSLFLPSLVSLSMLMLMHTQRGVRERERERERENGEGQIRQRNCC